MLKGRPADMVVLREMAKASRVGRIVKSIESGLDSDLASDWIVGMSSVSCSRDGSLASVVGAMLGKELERSDGH